jgi:hypothetical protein
MEVIESTSSTHTLELPTFLGWQYASLVMLKYLAKFTFWSSCNEYCGYTTPRSSMTSWTRNFPYNSLTSQLTTLAIYKNPHQIPKSKAQIYKNLLKFDTHMKMQNKLQKYKKLGWTKLYTQSTLIHVMDVTHTHLITRLQSQSNEPTMTKDSITNKPLVVILTFS